jgi:hypothetical protein
MRRGGSVGKGRDVLLAARASRSPPLGWRRSPPVGAAVGIGAGQRANRSRTVYSRQHGREGTGTGVHHRVRYQPGISLVF